MPRPGVDPDDPIVLDTSAYSRLRIGHADVLSVLARAPIVYLPVVVIGELEAAFDGGSRPAENRAILAQFIDEPFVQVVGVDVATARRYGALVGALQRAGTPLPANDVWIAAVTSGTDGFLVTFDRDFARIPDLRCVVLS
jgi:predicted nucleic acid-binding protein